MAKATMKGQIEEYVSKSGNKIIKDFQEIFSLLDEPISSKQPRIILVEGSPGVGKTFLLKHLSYLWAKGKLLMNSKVLFLLYLRDPAVHNMNSLHDLVHHFYGCNKDASEIATSYATKLLQDGGKFVTLLLDGYDEYPDNLRQHSFIAGILQRKILPACAIVISSRAHASTKLRSNVACRVEILGFSEDDQKDFIQQSLEEEPDKIPMLDEYLKTHPVIASLCYIPFYMTVLLFLYTQEKTLPTSSTELYNLFICLTICRHLNKCGMSLEEDVEDLNQLLKCLPQSYKDIITKLSKLAFKALDKRQLVFSGAEIVKLCPEINEIPGAINGFGLLQAVEYVGRMSKKLSFNFLHLSVQEFLAADYVANLSPDEEFSIIKEKFWEQNYLNMFTFYVALTKGQRSSFKKFLSGENNTIAIDSKFLNDKLKSIQLYRCFYEASGDDHVCRSIERKFSNGKLYFYRTTLSANDIENIAIFLTCCSIKQWSVLDMGNCYIQDAGLHILYRILTSSSITIEKLLLNSNGLSSSSDNYLADIVITCGVKILGIGYNKTIGQMHKFFPTIISSPPSMLEELNICDIDLSSRASTLFTALKEKTKLKKLVMANSNITDDICDAMVEALQVNSTLEHLNIESNNIGEEAIKLIIKSLSYNNTMSTLIIPDYSEDVNEQLLTLRDNVYKERVICHGNQANLFNLIIVLANTYS